MNGAHPYRSTCTGSRPRRAARHRVAWAWLLGRLIRYGRKRTPLEIVLDRWWFLALAICAIGAMSALWGITIDPHSGAAPLLWCEVALNVILFLLHVGLAVQRRVLFNRRKPSIRARYQDAARA